MLIMHQDRKSPVQFSAGDQAFVRAARLARGAVLVLMILGLAWIGANADTYGGRAPESRYAENQ